MTLVVNTNSYISVADATTYFNDSLNAVTWSAIDPDTQAQSLITAARMLDRQPWAGQKTDPAQAMQWPRTNVVDMYGNPIDPSSVPVQVLNANCELALAIFLDPTVQTVKNTDFNIKVVKAGTAEVEFMRPMRGGRFPTLVQELIGQFLASGLNIAVGESTGTDQFSKFDKSCPINNYDVNNGFS